MRKMLVSVMASVVLIGGLSGCADTDRGIEGVTPSKSTVSSTVTTPSSTSVSTKSVPAAPVEPDPVEVEPEVPVYEEAPVYEEPVYEGCWIEGRPWDKNCNGLIDADTPIG